MADRSEVIARIRALRDRAADQASSESEAAAAARIAARIIAEHEITEAELIERGVSGITEGTHNEGRQNRHPALTICAFHIGKLCECRSLSLRGTNIWIGQPEDVEFAIYLCEVIQGASERAYKRHWQRQFRAAPSPKYRKSFLMGFGNTVALRLNEMAEQRQRERAQASTSGTDLVAVKSALISQHMEKKYPGIKNRRPMRAKPILSAATAGMAAGRDVNLTRPIEDDARDRPQPALEVSE